MQGNGNSVLVLFSGGKDSFLTAVRAAQAGRRAILLSLDNGAVQGGDHVLHGAHRLKSCYGDSISFAGTYCTASTIYRLDEAWTYMPWKELGEKYPAMSNVHVRCLHCQTAMWIAAIAYAKAKGIPAIAAGYKDVDEFCTGTPLWTGLMARLAESNGVHAEFPLWEDRGWDNDESYGRDTEMILAGFKPAVLEPRCMLGRPARRPDGNQLRDMEKYFHDAMEPAIQPQIDRLEKIMSVARLSAKPLDSALPPGEAERYLSELR